MLEGVADLTLARLNEATLAWIEMNTTGPSILNLEKPSATLPPPMRRGAPVHGAELQMAFTAETAHQRRSDGTFSLKGIRLNSFPLPPFSTAQCAGGFLIWQVHWLIQTGARRLFSLDKRKTLKASALLKALH